MRSSLAPGRIEDSPDGLIDLSGGTSFHPVDRVLLSVDDGLRPVYLLLFGIDGLLLAVDLRLKLVHASLFSVTIIHPALLLVDLVLRAIHAILMTVDFFLEAIDFILMTIHFGLLPIDLALGRECLIEVSQSALVIDEVVMAILAEPGEVGAVFGAPVLDVALDMIIPGASPGVTRDNPILTNSGGIAALGSLILRRRGAAAAAPGKSTALPTVEDDYEAKPRQASGNRCSVQNPMNAVICFSVSSHSYSFPMRDLHATLHELQEGLCVGSAVFDSRQSGIVTGLFGRTNDPVVHPPTHRAEPKHHAMNGGKQLHGGIVPSNVRLLVGQDSL